MNTYRGHCTKRELKTNAHSREQSSSVNMHGCLVWYPTAIVYPKTINNKCTKMALRKQPCTEKLQSPPIRPLLLLSQTSFRPLPPSLWLLLPLLLSMANAQSIQGFVYWDSDLNGILSEGALDRYGTVVHGECISALQLLLLATMQFVSRTNVKMLEDGLAQARAAVQHFNYIYE